MLVVYAGPVQRRPPYELALVTELSPEDIAIAGEREGGRRGEGGREGGKGGREGKRGGREGEEEGKRGRKKGGGKGWTDEGEALTSHASNSLPRC